MPGGCLSVGICGLSHGCHRCMRVGRCISHSISRRHTKFLPRLPRILIATKENEIPSLCLLATDESEDAITSEFLAGILLSISHDRDDDGRSRFYCCHFLLHRADAGTDGIIERRHGAWQIGASLQRLDISKWYALMASLHLISVKQHQREAAFILLLLEHADVFIEAGDCCLFIGLHGASLIEHETDECAAGGC